MSRYTVLYEQASDGNWAVLVPDLPGVNSWGKSKKEAAENVLDAIGMWAEYRREHGEVIPQPAFVAGEIEVDMDTVTYEKAPARKRRVKHRPRRAASRVVRDSSTKILPRVE